MTEQIETTENVFEALDLPYHAKAMEIVAHHYSDETIRNMDRRDREKALISAISSALEDAVREAEAPLLEKNVELSSKIQRLEEINGNLRKSVRDQPIKWNDEYYEMKMKEARLQEREACAKIVDTHEEASREIGFSEVADSANLLATAIRNRGEA